MKNDDQSPVPSKFVCPDCGTPLPASAPGGGFCPRCLMGSETLGRVTSSTSPAEFTPPSPSELNAVIDGIEIDELIGRGGMGAVYRALQPRLNRKVAIKILSTIEDESERAAFDERFEREAQTMAKLNHPNIVGVHDFGETDAGQLFIVMEYVEGTDLATMIRTGELKPEHALGWVPQICDALNFAHENGVVHRDIKPSNILISADARIAKVTDFGIARLIEEHGRSRMTLTGTSVGTPEYVAPEQIEEGSAVDHRADIYSLGVLMYELLTGKLPKGAWKPPSERTGKEHVTLAFDPIVHRAMQSEPNDRYQDATQVRLDVEKINPREAAPAPQKSDRRSFISRPAGLGLALALVITIVAVLFQVFSRPTNVLAPTSGDRQESNQSIQINGNQAIVVPPADSELIITDGEAGGFSGIWQLGSGAVGFEEGALDPRSRLFIDGATLRTGAQPVTVQALEMSSGELVLEGQITTAKARLTTVALPIGNYTATDLASIGLTEGIIDAGGSLEVTEGGFPSPVEDKVFVYHPSEIANAKWPSDRHWNGPSPGSLPPDAPDTDFSDYDYYMAPFTFLNTTGQDYFGGRSLTVRPGNAIEGKGRLTIPDLRLDGGCLRHRDELFGRLTVTAETVLDPGTSFPMELEAELVGHGGLHVHFRKLTTLPIVLKRDNPNYHGRWRIGGVLLAEAEKALGDGPILIERGTLKSSVPITGGALEIDGPGQIILTHRMEFASGRVNGRDLPPGEYTGEDFVELGIADSIQDYGGTLVLTAVPPAISLAQENEAPDARQGRVIQMRARTEKTEGLSGWHWDEIWEGTPPSLSRRLPDGLWADITPHLYVVGPGMVLKSPGYSLNTDYFGGKSLTIDGGVLELWATSGTMVFQELVLTRGDMHFGAVADQRSIVIEGNVLVRGDFHIGNEDTLDKGHGMIFLDGDLRSFEGSHLRVSLDDESSLCLGGDNTGFKSAWTFNSGTIVAETSHALGASEVYLRGDARLTIQQPQKIQLLQLDASGVHIALGADIEVMRGPANAPDELPPGTYTAEQANAFFGYALPPFSGNGIIRVLDAE